MTEYMGHGVKQRAQIAMTQEEIDAFLHGRHTMTMCTMNPDGNIHAVGMWYGFLEGAIAVESKAKAQKVQNVRRDPRITCMIETGEFYEELQVEKARTCRPSASPCSRRWRTTPAPRTELLPTPLAP